MSQMKLIGFARLNINVTVTEVIGGVSKPKNKKNVALKCLVHK